MSPHCSTRLPCSPVSQRHRRKLGYPIYYYQEGAGPCAGVSAADGAATTGAASAPVEGLPMRSFGAWVRGLAQYKWGAVMFTVAILAGGEKVMSPPASWALPLTGHAMSAWDRAQHPTWGALPCRVALRCRAAMHRGCASRAGHWLTAWMPAPPDPTLLSNLCSHWLLPHGMGLHLRCRCRHLRGDRCSQEPLTLSQTF